MIVTKVYLAAMSRADASAKTLSMLPNFYFYVDEFQSFANQSFADILSEARKYKLNLIIAHQYIEQMEEEVRDAVFGNVGTTCAFRVGPFDAEVLETIFQPKFMATDLVNLGFAQIYLTLMIDGSANTDRFFTEDGNLEYNVQPGIVTLEPVLGVYSSNGYLESSTFDTGAAATFFDISWAPSNQPVSTGADPVKFQIATSNNDDGPCETEKRL
jgi:hypothetical protein